jgi:hypothetical protein
VEKLLGQLIHFVVHNLLWMSGFLLLLLGGLLQFVFKSIAQRRLAFTDYRKSDITEMYRELRGLALGFKPADLGLQLPENDETAFGIVVDCGDLAGIATLTAFSSGDASLYFSAGGGVLGGIGHQSVREAAKALVFEAQGRLASMPIETTFPLPSMRYARFHVLTQSGVHVTTVRVQPIEQGYAALWEATQRTLAAVLETRSTPKGAEQP